MPVEAIHLSAYVDSLKQTALPLGYGMQRPLALGRLGAIVVDFPYFARFPIGVARYLLGRPTAVARWGDMIHHGTPIAVAHSLLASVRRLRASPSSRAQAEDVLAFSLGLVSHYAVDRALHPLVNQLARQRAAKSGHHPSQEHTEVEKFHSVLFHEERNGFDFMGRPELAQHIAVEGRAVSRDVHLSAALSTAFAHAFGEAPSAAEWRSWARGYRQYVALVSGWFGTRLVPDALKPQVREELYSGDWGTFPERYAEAVDDSRRAIEVAYALAESEANRAAFEALLPEGPIDDG